MRVRLTTINFINCTHIFEYRRGRMGDSRVNVFSSNLESESSPDGVQGVSECDRSDACTRSCHEFIRVRTAAENTAQVLHKNAFKFIFNIFPSHYSSVTLLYSSKDVNWVAA